MPPRTTRKSDRRKVSDRTMVGTAQPLCLSASRTERRRYDSTMNLRRRKIHSVSFHYWGWTANTLCFAVAGEAFVLTSPFIERSYPNLAPAEPSRNLTLFSGQTTMPPAMPAPTPRRFFMPALLVCFFFSGAAGLIYQVVWSKALGLIFGHTAYAVATVLAVFMAGLASGSAWIGRRSDAWNH